MSVLVTGAAGFLGFHVASRLIELGVEVVGVDALLDDGHRALKQARLAHLSGLTGFQFAPLDLAEPGEALGVLEATGARRVVHLAGRGGVRGDLGAALLVRDNVLATATLLDACAATEVEHVVIGSSSSVYGDAAVYPTTERAPVDRPLGDYAASKRSAELVVAGWTARTGIPATVLRMFTVYGPWGRPDMAMWRFASAIEDGERIALFGDDRARDFTYVTDVAEGLVHAVVSGVPGTYNLCLGQPVPVRQVIELLARHLERLAVVETHPPHPADPQVTWGDGSAFGRDVGFVPSVGIEEGVERFVAWWRSL